MNFQYRATGGVGIINFAITSGEFPAGLSMNATGLVTGQRTTQGNYSWQVTATDALGSQAVLSDSSENLPFTISGAVPDGDSGTATSGTYDNTHGNEPITYAVTSGTFPVSGGLASDGTWSGSYLAADDYSWTVTGTDDEGNTAQVMETCTVAVNASAALLDAAITDAYNWNDNQTSLFDAGQSWANFFGGGAVHAYTTGLFGKRAMLSVQSYVNTPGTDGYDAATEDFFFAELVYIDTSTNGIELIGFSESSAHAVYNGLEVTVSGGSASVRFRTLDASDPMQPYIYSPDVVVAAGYHLFIASYATATRRWTLYHNNTTVGQTPVYYGAGVPNSVDRWKHCLDPYVGIAFGDLPRVLRDESFCGIGLVITTTIRDYLYNGGSFKSYAQIVADGTP